MSALADTFSRFIARQTGARSARVIDFDKLSGGAIQDNFGLTLELEGGSRPGRQEFVVRQDAPSAVAESLSRPQEFRVLQAAFRAGVTAPEPLWLCEDPEVSERVFYVMTRAAGSASPRKLVKADFSKEQRRNIVRRLGAELARLHTVKPPQESLAFLALPDPGNPALSRIALYRRYLKEIGEPHPVLEWALNWLEDHVPEAGPTVLCHCDFRTGNYMMDGDQLTAVLDWEFAAWSDPCEDLGWLCSRSWRFGADDREVGGVGDRQDLLEGYREVSGVELDPAKVSYWEVMALVRWAMIALQQARRHMSGEQRSLELALTGRMVAQMELDLLNQIQELEDGK
ncbi:phosphotransferase family protein [Marinobacter orientalis]|uniref:Phosphotransferase family protein n=1 Tax=Marinobacter orientalis TaxID=1928859 RepID=A0A7Y0RBG2_9GAMM|nr:phosphotransferase family protein [Marinobacter orientalis]NMT63157.1 phosphotransferase family protein [Marinobacter orientalis]TGX51814.1 phosphotransferase family protein [Marinobacter orientalis]